REPLGTARGVGPAALADLGDAPLVAIVQAEAIAQKPQVGHERDAAEARTDDRHGGRFGRLVHARQSTTFATVRRVGLESMPCQFPQISSSSAFPAPRPLP